MSFHKEGNCELIGCPICARNTCVKCGRFIAADVWRCETCEKEGKCQECVERQLKIDALYRSVWDLVETCGSLKNEILEIGEAMKEIASSECFK